MCVLTDYEKSVLARIPTTIDQAKTILKRNTSLLEILTDLNDEYDPYTSRFVNIGCPHCTNKRGIYWCETCDWNIKLLPGLKHYRTGGYLEEFHCCHVTFGGYCLSEITEYRYVRIIYTHNSSMIVYNLAASIFEERKEKEYRACCKFLQGHIEWANSIIKQDLLR